MLRESFDHGVVTLEMANPPANALGNQLIAELRDAIVRRSSSPDTRAVILTGSGNRFFSAGGDVKELEGLTISRAEQRLADFHELVCALESFPAPVVAAVNGYAIGGALELCLFSDYSICVSDARFGFPEINHGILPLAKGVDQAVRTLGLKEARRILYGGQLFDAAHALRIGAVDEVVEPDDLHDRARSVAAEFAAKDRTLFHALKRTINDTYSVSAAELKQNTLSQLGEYFGTNIMTSGLNAFRGRR